MADMRPPTVALDQAHLERHRIIAHRKDNPNTAAVDLLRTKLLQRMGTSGYRTLGIVGASPAVGKTVLAVNLAISIARLPETSTLLVDLDLRSPSVNDYLGLRSERTVGDYLQGRCAFGEVLTYPDIPRCVVAGENGAVPNSAELLASRRTEKFVAEVKHRYPDRIVLFDLPPLLCGDDAIAVLPNIDCVLLVFASGVSSRSDMEESMRLVRGAKLLGTVINKAPVDPEDLGYGY